MGKISQKSLSLEMQLEGWNDGTGGRSLDTRSSGAVAMTRIARRDGDLICESSTVGQGCYALEPHCWPLTGHDKQHMSV